MQQVHGEVDRRETSTTGKEYNPMVQQILAANHAYFLGFSPAYAAVQVMQVGTHGLPELGKKFGYVKSARAITKATGEAFAVMREVGKLAIKSGVWQGADIHITDEVLHRLCDFIQLHYFCSVKLDSKFFADWIE